MSLQVLDEDSRFNLHNIQQMRRQRLKTLINKLCRFCIDCYSDISLVIAVYELTPQSEPPRVAMYYIIEFTMHQKPRLNPFNVRGKRKATLGRMLQDYLTDFWQEESRKFKLNCKQPVLDDNFPSSKTDLETFYPPPVRITPDNYLKHH
ncbi:hypothetical protein D8B26_001567 [Coccidioides posadasii str. Silveira]|uniref:uncharacterized protein n=1 Tax=Coccidioides posadasii (strain RMSCC 757 / Silveira) TaxID=443226 RepID=UPI001BED6D8C|nr:hypothetical protein D8B26_001567 [Coccidioides posadasii str. Silveira]